PERPREPRRKDDRHVRVARERLSCGDRDRELADLVRLEPAYELERVPLDVVVINAGLDACDRTNQRIRLDRMERASRRAGFVQGDELVSNLDVSMRAE